MIDRLMVTRKCWEEFRKTGLLWFINSILHIFGWAIVVKQDNNIIVDVYPARVKFRGFDDKDNMEGYINISTYMVENAIQLKKETMEEVE